MNFTRSSYERRMGFKWTSLEFHMKWNQICSYEFTCSLYRRTNGVNMLYPYNTNEVDMRLINISHEIHRKFIWISNYLKFMWTSCELHKNYLTSTQEFILFYKWIWFLASLLCTSWASMSIERWPPAAESGLRVRSDRGMGWPWLQGGNWGGGVSYASPTDLVTCRPFY